VIVPTQPGRAKRAVPQVKQHTCKRWIGPWFPAEVNDRNVGAGNLVVLNYVASIARCQAMSESPTVCKPAHKALSSTIRMKIDLTNWIGLLSGKADS
jgi:hypothetical protein